MNALAIETGPSNAYIVNAWTIEAPNATIFDHTPNRLVVRTVRRLLARGCQVDGVYYNEGKQRSVAVRDLARRDIYEIDAVTRTGVSFTLKIELDWRQDWDNRITRDHAWRLLGEDWVYEMLRGM
jgi:hypothetical protein